MKVNRILFPVFVAVTAAALSGGSRMRTELPQTGLSADDVPAVSSLPRFQLVLLTRTRRPQAERRRLRLGRLARMVIRASFGFTN